MTNQCSLLCRSSALLAACALAVGCKVSAPPAPPPPSPQAQPASNDDRGNHVVHLAQDPTPQPDGPRDATPAMKLMYVVDIFQINVPRGTFSRNDEFWKRIDESVVDVGTHDLLDKNGVRVGSASMRELEHFKKFVDTEVPSKRMSITGHEAQDIELSMNPDLPGQDIFVFNSANESVGRTYDKCSNFINVSFSPTPRNAQSVRIGLCPMVRTSRKRLEYSTVSSTDSEREIRYESPEMIYDLNLRVDVPLDRFLIVAPSEESMWAWSVGNAFLRKNGPTEKLEQVILIVPHMGGEFRQQPPASK